MGNIVKFNESRLDNSIKSGGFNIGVNDTPTDLTGFYNGITPILSGYTIYIDKASGGPSIYAPQNDTDLINITKSLGGNVSTATEALVWINSQSNMTVVNGNYPSIVTDGLVLNLDAGFVSSYPKTGTSWRDLSGNNYTGTLTNGPTFSSEGGGSIVFDGVNDRVDIPEVSLESGWTQRVIFKNTASTQTTAFRAAIHGSTSVNAPGFFRLFNDVSGGLSRVRIVIRLQTNAGTWTNLSLYPGPYSSSYVSYQSQDEFWVNRIIDLTITLTSDRIYTIYLNGDVGVISNRSNSNDLNNNLSVNRIGLFQTSSEPLQGNVYLSSFYNKALTSSEVLQNYYAGLQRFIPTDGLVLSLDAQNTNLYATSPTTTYDISGNGNNGSMLNGVQYDSEGNGSYYFDGTNDSITIPSSSSLLTITSGISICFWVKLGTGKTDYNRFFTKSGFATYLGIRGNDGFMIWYSNLGNWVAGYSGPSGQRITNGSGWAFVCYTYNGSTQIIYKNGSQLLSRSITGDFTTSSNSLVVSDSSFNGWLGVSYIYNRALTSTEITTIYNATRTKYGL